MLHLTVMFKTVIDLIKLKSLNTFSCKVKPLTRDNLNKFRSDLLVDNDSFEDSDADIKDIIEANGSESTLLVNSTSANDINPVDIRKLMSTSNKGKTSPTISKKVAFKSELRINGKPYREVGKYFVYYLSN